VATGGRRDDDALENGLRRFVAAHPDLVPGGPPAHAGAGLALTHAEGGMANETVLVDLGPGHPGIVVRLPPVEPTFPGYDLGPQAAVQNAVAVSGVPAPAPAVVIDDTNWVGAPFLAMPRVRGDIAGPAPLYDPYVTDAGQGAQRAMHDALLDTVAAVHAVRWREADLGEVFGATTLREALGRWRAYVEWSSGGAPLTALAEALAWCEGTAPAERDPVLLWGDVRLGNLVFDGHRRVVAVLDWDLASLGPREMDLGWHFGLEHMMERLFGERVPGFPSRDDAVARYERATGYEVRNLGWHEVFALVRALAINDRHQRITGDPRREANPMGAILLERMAEVERTTQ
jgi:aminoglycoside phosphotransferase (APT) family kinase protein